MNNIERKTIVKEGLRRLTEQSKLNWIPKSTSEENQHRTQSQNNPPEAPELILRDF